MAVVRRWVSGATTPYRRSLGHEIEDIEQEVLLALVEALREGRFEGRSSLATYVRSMVLHRILPPGPVAIALEALGPDGSRSPHPPIGPCQQQDFDGEPGEPAEEGEHESRRRR